MIQLTTPTVIINIIFGESQGQLWLEKVVTSFMDAPYGDLFKQKCEGVKILRFMPKRDMPQRDMP